MAGPSEFAVLANAAVTCTDGSIVGDVTITGADVAGCEDGRPGRPSPSMERCDQGVGNGPEGCDPGDSNHRLPTNDEDGGTPGDPGRKGGGC